MDLTKPQIAAAQIKRILTEFSKDTHNTFTPFELCEEVIDKIPSLNGKILVIANLEFLYILRSKGIESNRLYFATPCPVKARAAKTLVDENNIIKYNNVLKEEDVTGMKFDVVIGNPPYQSSVGNLQQRLWMDFVDIAFEVLKPNGILAFVTPTNWAVTPKLYNKWFASKNVIAINMDECAKHFPGVGISFSWYIIQNTQNDGNPTYLITPTKQFNQVLPSEPIGSNIDALPIISKVTKTSDKRLIAYAPQTHYSYFAKGKVSKKKSKEFPHKVLLSPASSKRDAKWVWGRTVCDKQVGPRVITNMWPGNWKKMIVSEELQTTHSFIHIPANNLKEAKNLKLYLSSKIISFVVYSLNSMRNINPRTICQLPKIDLSRSWTDEELYEHFKLTEEEIKLIEETIT